MSFIKEFWEFLRVRKKYWLLPIIFVLVLFLSKPLDKLKHAALMMKEADVVIAEADDFLTEAQVNAKRYMESIRKSHFQDDDDPRDCHNDNEIMITNRMLKLIEMVKTMKIMMILRYVNIVVFILESSCLAYLDRKLSFNRNGKKWHVFRIYYV